MSTATPEQYEQLFEHIRNLHNNLRWLSDRLHQQHSLTSTTRSLLLTLHTHGPHTVPDMARDRFVSRQIIQTQINILLDQGLVESTRNPRHRRSPLMQLTDTGEKMAQAILATEASAIRNAQIPIDGETMAETLGTLHTLREALLEIKLDHLGY